jgi:predicted nucleic acid-binding protein
MEITEDLGSGRIGVDTAIFIYFIEASPKWLPAIMPLFQAADSGQRELVTSTVTLLEVLVVPYRMNNTALAARYEALLTQSRGIRLIELTRDHFRHAARMRAATNLGTADALQLSAARAAGCATFVTNDRRLPPVPGLRVVQLSSYDRQSASDKTPR